MSKLFLFLSLEGSPMAVSAEASCEGGWNWGKKSSRVTAGVSVEN